MNLTNPIRIEAHFIDSSRQTKGDNTTLILHQPKWNFLSWSLSQLNQVLTSTSGNVDFEHNTSLSMSSNTQTFLHVDKLLLQKNSPWSRPRLLSFTIHNLSKYLRVAIYFFSWICCLMNWTGAVSQAILNIRWPHQHLEKGLLRLKFVGRFKSSERPWVCGTIRELAQGSSIY